MKYLIFSLFSSTTLILNTSYNTDNNYHSFYGNWEDCSFQCELDELCNAFTYDINFLFLICLLLF